MASTVSAIVLFTLLSAPPEVSWKASGTHGAVAAGGAGAVDAGVEILKAGGNAADAAAAVILALSVTDSGSFCFGGEVPILVYDAKHKGVETICGLGAAPRLATREYFSAKGGIPASGLEPAAVPAALDACITLLDRHGTRTFADVAAAALRLLERGEREKSAPETSAPEKKSPEKGPPAWHADLAATLRRLIDAEKGSPADRRRGLRLVADYFYRGPLAREISDWCAANGGLIRSSDLATHVTRIEDPAHVEYRGREVFKCGVWTQGPSLLEALNLLEGFDLRASGLNRPATIHLAVEAMKLAFADRDVYYADPLFEDVPAAALLSKEYAAVRRPLIDREKASLALRPGDPRGLKPLRGAEPTRAGSGGTPMDTTTCLVADLEGNVVAATPSGWSGVLVGRTGVWLGTRLQSFNTWEGHPNCVAPGKRPRITLTPTLVLKGGRPVLAVSVAGGDGQDQASLQMVLDAIDFGLAPEESVTAVRFGTDHFVGSFRQTPPRLGSLSIHEDAGEAVISGLKALGHQVTAVRGPLWAPSVMAIDPATGMKQAAGDPRAGRHAGAY